MHHSRQLLAFAAVAGLVLSVGACAENPSLAPSEHSEELSVDLTVEPDHVHLLQTEAAFHVSVTDHDGAAVTDFDSLRVEWKPESETEWDGAAAHLHDGEYEAHNVFHSSGHYDLRVTGQRPDHSDMSVMHEMSDALHVARAHAEAGGYRVEFEGFPGHVHAGDTASLSFWVMEQDTTSSGERPPIEGLQPEVHVTEADGSTASVAASETSAGVYEAEHLFQEGGDALVALHFTGSSGQEAEAEFTLPVSHAH